MTRRRKPGKAMLPGKFLTLLWKYDRYAASVIVTLPQSHLRYSLYLGRVTLPSIWALTLVVIGLFFLYDGRQDMALLNAVVAACIPISTILKLIVRRERPKTIFAKNMKIKSYSFPSSHAYAAALVGGYLTLLSLTLFPSPIYTLIASIFSVLIVAIGISRVHIGAHYPTDVTAGWLLGISVLSPIAHYSIL